MGRSPFIVSRQHCLDPSLEVIPQRIRFKLQRHAARGLVSVVGLNHIIQLFTLRAKPKELSCRHPPDRTLWKSETISDLQAATEQSFGTPRNKQQNYKIESDGFQVHKYRVLSCCVGPDGMEGLHIVTSLRTCRQILAQNGLHGSSELVICHPLASLVSQERKESSWVTPCLQGAISLISDMSDMIKHVDPIQHLSTYQVEASLMLLYSAEFVEGQPRVRNAELDLREGR